MREFLEDAEAHREDGYGRAQAHAKRELPKRFYKDAAVQPMDGGYAVGLDGRVPRSAFCTSRSRPPRSASSRPRSRMNRCCR